VLDVSLAGGCASPTDSGLLQNIKDAIDSDLKSASVVSNDITTKPTTTNWSGGSNTISGDDILDIKDFITTIMFSLDAPEGQIIENFIESVFKLPLSSEKADGSHKTIKEYYGLDNMDYSMVVIPDSDSINSIDANGDGKVDIADVVALRNIWIYQDEYPTSSSSAINSGLRVVPTKKCVSFDDGIDLLLPTNCSTFCATTDCFSKIWLSDLMEMDKDGDGVAKNYLLEVSYSVDCEDDIHNIVEDISGVQFRIEGLKRKGIS
jgi:hypothetical protein